MTPTGSAAGFEFSGVTPEHRAAVSDLPSSSSLELLELVAMADLFSDHLENKKKAFVTALDSGNVPNLPAPLSVIPPPELAVI